MRAEAPRRAVTLDEVRAHRDAIKRLGERFGVRNIRVFGSVARGEATPDSDLDLLVDVDRGHGYFDMAGFALGVEDELGVLTQVATPGGLKLRIRDRVLREAVAPVRRDNERLADIIEAANKIAIRAVKGRGAFDADEDTQIVLVHLIQVIGEAAAGLSDGFIAQHPEVPWRQIIATRNRVVHGYFEVDLDILWDVAVIDVPELVP